MRLARGQQRNADSDPNDLRDRALHHRKRDARFLRLLADKQEDFRLPL